MYNFYTSYIGKLKDNSLPKNAMKIIIMRFPLFVPKAKDIVVCTELGPNNEIFKKFKNNNNWQEFKEEFIRQIHNDKDTIKYIDYTIDALNNYNDIIYVCCEKDNSNCHRKIFGEYYQSLGYTWQEI